MKSPFRTEKTPVTVAPDLPVDALVEDYIYKYHYDLFPVVRGDRVRGLVTARQVKQVPRRQWAYVPVADIMVPITPDNSIAPTTDAVKALSIMRRSGNSRLLVLDGARQVGIVALKDMLAFFGLRMDLEGM